MQLFEGSWDQNSTLTHLFNEAVLAQYVRIRPQDWHVGIGLRVELLGCPGTIQELNFSTKLYNIEYSLRGVLLRIS